MSTNLCIKRRRTPKCWPSKHRSTPLSFFAQAGRSFVREGDLLKHTSDGSSTRRYHFFLFTDSIAYGQQIFKGYYKFHRLVSIFDVSDPSEVSNDENRELQFIIKGDEKDLRLEAETEALKTEWLTDIRGLVAKLEENKEVVGFPNRRMSSFAQRFEQHNGRPGDKPKTKKKRRASTWV
mmetsp:Transcript_79331/g.226615  ORF Transcript_79331/g.226615 Transcript_79331/m.226615 type:complete len:179 (+) Transcript_79331:268-804(+)